MAQSPPNSISEAFEMQYGDRPGSAMSELTRRRDEKLQTRLGELVRDCFGLVGGQAVIQP
jgi:hypothetical protein